MQGVVSQSCRNFRGVDGTPVVLVSIHRYGTYSPYSQVFLEREGLNKEISGMVCRN